MGYFDFKPFETRADLAPSTLVGGTSTSSLSSLMSYAGPIMGIFGAISSGFGSYFQAQSVASNLQFQSDMAAINARMAEKTAQSILDAGEKQSSMLSQKYGAAKASAKTRQAARGVQMGVGSAAEEIASIDLAKETDRLMIDANAQRQAGAARTQATNMANESLLKGTMAAGINPFAALSTSLLGSASHVASRWYKTFGGGA